MRYEGKNATDTTETARGETRTEKAQLASEEFASTRKGRRAQRVLEERGAQDGNI
jgi:hypothetical protein